MNIENMKQKCIEKNCPNDALDNYNLCKTHILLYYPDLFETKTKKKNKRISRTSKTGVDIRFGIGKRYGARINSNHKLPTKTKVPHLFAFSKKDEQKLLIANMPKSSKNILSKKGLLLLVNNPIKK